ncbi:MAG: O-antigen ligase family protein [Methylobacteriaceae bacterium]|nr:O-antigen ligase family protein [Methylobacteriaceae bacterium]
MSSTDALTMHYQMAPARPADDLRLERTTSVLFIGFLLLTFIGTHPLQTGSVAQRADGSILDRIVVFSLFGLALAVIWMARDVALRTLTRNLGLIFIVGFCLASIAWSQFPALTLRRSVLFFLLTAISFAVAVGATDLRRLHTQLFATLAIIIAINILATIALPGDAITPIGVKGIYTQKNVAGIVALITMVVGATWLVGAGKRHILLALLVLAATFGFLFVTKSRTSMNLALLGVAGVVFVALAEKLGATFLMAAGLAGALILAAALVWLALYDFEFSAALAALIGDTSYSGREELWAFARQDAEKRFWLGYGYGAYWDVGQAKDPLLRAEFGSWLASVETGVINQAHHGYLELWLHIGLPMTVFATFYVTQRALIGGARALFCKGRRESRVFLGGLAAILLLFLLHNLTEASLFMRGEIFSNFSVFALLLLSRARDLDTPMTGRL